MGTMANSEDPDEMHQGLNCLRQNRFSEKEIQYFLGNYNL